MNIDGQQQAPINTNLHKKYYQQALYYYFQSNYSAALNIISDSKLRLKSLDQTSQLFTAGLQVSLGLQEQAKQSLLLFDHMQRESKERLSSEKPFEKQTQKNQHKAKSEQLLVLALLSLTEQFIAQGEVMQAQQTLAKIPQVTQRYYQQYHVLSQLAYWPKQPDLLPMSGQEGYQKKQNVDASLHDVVYKSPYIQLNNALRLIEEEKYTQAISLLAMIKNSRWQAAEQTFWQLLFATDKDFSLEKQAEEQLQNQAVNDYARLLLAQLYTQQEAYEKAFFELKTFPQQSPYTEPALFLFAFSAQQVKQHTTALSLLTLLHEQYPYSHLGWQAGLLMAKQVTEQKGLAQGWQAYQKVEHFFLATIEKLNHFEKSYSTNAELLSFSTTTTANHKAVKNHLTTPFIEHLKLEKKLYAPESVWLQQALYDTTLNSLYQQLVELTVLAQHNQKLQHKNDWIAETINLNTQRKAGIAASQITITQQGAYEKLLEKRASLSAALALALSDPQQHGFAFANEKEQVLLDRLQRSKENLADIINYSNDHGNKDEQANIDDYQQRLTRISAVLTWQISQRFPQRAWQHRQQLAALDKNLKDVESLQKKISQLSVDTLTGQKTHSLSQLSNRKIKADKQINQLNKHLKQLKSKVSLNIRIKVAYYIDQQRTLLTQHLLTTRSAMAVVLEKMSTNDKKIEHQLNLDAQTVKEQAL